MFTEPLFLSRRIKLCLHLPLKTAIQGLLEKGTVKIWGKQTQSKSTVENTKVHENTLTIKLLWLCNSWCKVKKTKLMILFYLWKIVFLNKSDCRQKAITGSTRRASHVAIQGCVSNKPGKERKMNQKFWLVKSRKILL